MIAASPDGRQFVYTTAEGLRLRSLDQLESRLLPGTDASLSVPFFLPTDIGRVYPTVSTEASVAERGRAGRYRGVLVAAGECELGGRRHDLLRR